MDKKEYGDGWLYADDLIRNGKWDSVSLPIAEVISPNTIEAGHPKKLVDKWTLKFKGKTGEKLLALNLTNSRLLTLALGSSAPRDWEGKTITLYPAYGNCFGDKDVPWIRIQTPPNTIIPKGIRRHLGTSLVGTPSAQKATA